MMRRALATMVVGLTLTLPRAAHAAFHLMKVTEVFPGTAASPGAQYVVIQMWTGGQNIVGGHGITVYGPTGTVVGTFTFPGSVANGASQDKILIATTQAVTFFGLGADLSMTPVLSTS